jgi:hypothetical protein
MGGGDTIARAGVRSGIKKGAAKAGVNAATVALL